MKKAFIVAVVLAATALTQKLNAQVRVNVNVGIGTPVVYAPPPPPRRVIVYEQPPCPPPPRRVVVVQPRPVVVYQDGYGYGRRCDYRDDRRGRGYYKDDRRGYDKHYRGALRY
ncbi:MAG: hypothetical protein J0I41_07140 [Filimonas sp.]|nr:hypothetical protein [Filimonas sp.]